MKIHRIGFELAVLIAGFVFLDIAVAQISETKIIPSDGQMCDYFGWHMSLSGDWLVVGANHNQYGIVDGGFAYIFRHDTSRWTEQTKILASDNAGGDKFGYSVSISGDLVLVGAIGDDDNGNESGSVYAFVNHGSQWLERQKFQSGDISEGDFFGYDISISSDVALIGANQDDEKGTDAGAAYIVHYDRSMDSWVEQHKLTASDGADSAYFGNVVYLSGDTAIIGAWGDRVHGREAGAVYIFYYDGSSWVEQTKLTASDAAPSSRFGRAVSLSGNHIIIGAPLSEGELGSAYVFHYDGSNWVEQAKLVSSDRGAGDHFGKSVAIHGDYAIVGASRDDDLGNQAGSAYVYHYDGSSWVEQTKLFPSDGAPRDHFGRFVLLSEDYALIASTFDDINGIVDVGSVYCYTGYETQIPASPVLLSPSDGATGVSTSPTLSWTAPRGAEFYTLQVSDTTDFSRLIVDEDSLDAATFDVTGLSSLLTYSWRVRATNAFGTSNWSAVWSFTTGSIPCSELLRFQAQCVAGGTMLAKVTLDGVGHTGEFVEFAIDGTPYGETVGSNGRAVLSVAGFGPGSHTVELTEPPGCFPPRRVQCRVGMAKEGDSWDGDEIPGATVLFDNYPNPFNPSTTIRYGLHESGMTSLQIYNTFGQLMKTVVNEYQDEGYHEVVWDGRNESGLVVATGIYFYRLEAGTFVETKKLIFMK